MARGAADNGELRGCPTCGTPVGDTDLGLRDYRWVNEALPGRVGASDLDAVVQQSKSGRVLIMEFKPLTESVTLGQQLLLKGFVELGCDVWVVWDHGDAKYVTVGQMNREGRVPFARKMTRKKLSRSVRDWWDDGVS